MGGVQQLLKGCLLIGLSKIWLYRTFVYQDVKTKKMLPIQSIIITDKIPQIASAEAERLPLDRRLHHSEIQRIHTPLVEHLA